MIGLVGQIKRTTQLRWNRVYKFRTKIRMHLPFGPYTLKTAETQDELVESFQLRHEVFHREFRGLERTGLDVDKYDHHFDHLIIVHNETKKIIGTYRVNCSSFTDLSYTSQEFDLTRLFQTEGPYLELGRACIHKDHRRGAVISLLWRGIAEYMNQSGAKVLFGCSSLKINNPRDAALVYKYLEGQGAMAAEELTAKPTLPYEMPQLENWLEYFAGGLNEHQIAEAEELIPGLLKSYLKLGAKVAGRPAFDAEFDCIDMLTVLRKEDLADGTARRFQVNKES